jgi:hypothetical protein
MFLSQAIFASTLDSLTESAGRSSRDKAARQNRAKASRRGTTYGPMLPEGILEDDGVARGP